MLASRTALVDSLVRDHWASMPPGITICAVGGYGRSELFPHSDIDLLILTPDESTQADIKEPLSLCLRDLWDQKLRVSQSVHIPLDCNQIDSANAELAVSLLDRRFLAGDEALFRQIRDPKPELGRNIAELTHERHARFQNTLYHLEPNVKDSPGGLRDLQVLRWLAKLGAGTGQLPPGVDVLFEIRCFLHYLASRDDNKFSFDRQDEIATLCGESSPEDLMRRYYRAVRGIARLANRRLLQFETKGSSLFAQFRDRTSRLSNGDFSVLKGEIFFRSTTAASDPDTVFRIFDFVARHGLPLSTDAQERLEANMPRFEKWATAHQAIWPPFRDIIRQPHAAKALRAMHETGALEAIFPELRDMESLVIRDFNHRYTVDEHTLIAIGIILDLKSKQKDLFADLARETEDLDLLVVALLFHDVGKGTPNEPHCGVSNRIARVALRRAGVSERVWGIISFLILGHLDMSGCMSRDVSDPATAADLAGKTGTVECLRLLTLLTYADISAVHPTAMTSWRRTILWNLFAATHSELTRELTTRTAPAVIEGSPERRHFLEGLPPRYLRTHGEAEIARDMQLETESKVKGAGVSVTHGDAAWHVNVVTKDRPFLFASIAAAISSFGFNILKAEAFSNNHGTIIDTFAFSDPVRNLEQNPGELNDVTRTILRTVKGETSVDELLRRRPKVKPDPHAVAATRVQFDNDSSTTATLIELIAQDRPGLLYDVASVISKRGADIEVVLVDTEAKKALDVFYVTKAGNRLTDPEAADLANAIKAVVVPAQ